jgi:hypothetical protein
MTTVRSSRPEPAPQPLARLVELALVVPVEVSGRLLEAVPQMVDKVPSAANRVRREVVLARFLGKLAVDQGLRELRSRMSPDDPSPTDAGEAAPSIEDEAAPSGSLRNSDEVAPAMAPDADSLALADYDHLSSAQVISKLAGLDSAELDAIESYELASRHRRTILGKIDQLRSSGVES